MRAFGESAARLGHKKSSIANLAVVVQQAHALHTRQGGAGLHKSGGIVGAQFHDQVNAGGGQVDAEIFPEETVVYIADQGPGIPDIKLAMQEGWSTAPDHVRQMGFGAGMGLPNMMKCSDDFDIQSTVGSGTNIKMKFKHISEDL